MEQIECKIAIAVDEDGNWELTKADDDECTHGYDPDCLADNMSGAVRTVVITARIGKPAPLQVSTVIPDHPPQMPVEIEVNTV